MRTPDCHPDRKHCARGLCNACYRRWYRANVPGALEDNRARARAWYRAHAKDPEWYRKHTEQNRIAARLGLWGHGR